MFEYLRKRAALKRLYSPEGKADLERIAQAGAGKSVKMNKLKLGDLRYCPLFNRIQAAYREFE